MFSNKICVVYILTFTLLVGVNSITFLPKIQQNDTLQVVTTHGTVQGRETSTISGLTYFAYEGIPYARPPLDNLRFRSPQSATPWQGVLNATAQSTGCVEVRLRFISFETLGEEDCLYVNIYTSVNLKLSKKTLVPVIVWIYGGGFLEGASSLYGPDNLIENGLLVVIFNYRLGMFGFLNTEDEASPGNYGLKDQTLALRWIKDNIEKFGGDPKTITIAGQSAGAASVMYHVYSPRSKGLFSRAIASSGETTSFWANKKSPRTVAMDVALNMGLDTNNTTEILQTLRKANSYDLKRAQLLVIIVHGASTLQDGLPFTPAIEFDHKEAFITQDPFEIIKKKDFTPVPIMIGTTTLEGGLFGKLFNLLRPLLLVYDISPSYVPNGFKNISSSEAHEIGKKITRKYAEGGSFSSTTTRNIMEFFTDLLFTKPMMDTVRAISPQAPIYFFVNGHLDILIKKILEYLRFPLDMTTSETFHAEDVPLIWHYSHFGIPHSSRPMSKKYTRLWYNFVAYGYQMRCCYLAAMSLSFTYPTVRRIRLATLDAGEVDISQLQNIDLHHYVSQPSKYTGSNSVRMYYLFTLDRWLIHWYEELKKSNTAQGSNAR